MIQNRKKECKIMLLLTLMNPDFLRDHFKYSNNTYMTENIVKILEF